MKKKEDDSGKKKALDARSTMKEAKMIPILIYKLEAFEKDIIKLVMNTKI